MILAASRATPSYGGALPAAEPPVFCMEWNAENQLTRVLNNGSEVARYKYDPSGRRVERVAGGTTSLWAYDGEDILRETISASTTKYVQGPWIDEPLAQEDSAGVLSHLHADGLGSVVVTTNSAGAVIASKRNDAYGNLEAGAANGYGFTGREWDTAANLAYYRARYYDSKIGRFISEDPIGFDAGVNFYSYVLNNPINWIDPYGLKDGPPSNRRGDVDGRRTNGVPFDPWQGGWDAQRRQFPYDPDPYQGGYRHCVAACIIGRNVPGLGGLAVSIADVVRGEFGQDADSMADLAGEGAGLRCSSGKQSCELECLKNYPPLPELRGPAAPPRPGRPPRRR